MKINKKKLKSIVFSMVLAAGMLLPVSAMAQEDGRGGGLFGLFGLFNSEEAEVGMLGRGDASSEGGYGIFTEQFGQNDNGSGFNIGTEQFGNDAPLGSGLFILAAAGAGYALKKRKSNMKQ